MTLGQTVIDAFKRVLGEQVKLIVVHSSLIHLRPPSAFQKTDMLTAIKTMVDEGYTFAFPAFTLSFCRGKPFERTSRSETGILADWVFELDGASRTSNPIYSFVVIGPLSEKLHNCKNSTTFGDDSIFGMFEDYNAVLCMFGCSWQFCTQFHRYEEQARVSYRHFKTFTGQEKKLDGSVDVATTMFVRDLQIAAENDFAPGAEELKRMGTLRVVPLWRGKVQAAYCKDLAKASQKLLLQDELVFVRNRSHALQIIEQRKSSESRLV